MSLTSKQSKFLAQMTDAAWGGIDGSVVFAGEQSRVDMIGLRVLTEITPPTGRGPMVNMVMRGPLNGMNDAVLMNPDQAEELANRLLFLAAKARGLRK